MQQGCIEVCRWLSSTHGIQAPADWLEACMDWLNDNNDRPLTVTNLKDLVLEQWLLSNLCDIGALCLPPQLSQQHKATLSGSYALQINWMIDVASPYYSQLQKLEGQNTDNLNTSESERLPATQQPFQNKNTTRMLMMELTDGDQVVKAMEYQPIRCLHTALSPGTKILIKGQILCRLGMLMLKPENVHIIGGEVEDLIEANTQLSLLRTFLNDKKTVAPMQMPKWEGSGQITNPGGGKLSTNQQPFRNSTTNQSFNHEQSNQQQTFRNKSTNHRSSYTSQRSDYVNQQPPYGQGGTQPGQNSHSLGHFPSSRMDGSDNQLLRQQSAPVGTGDEFDDEVDDLLLMQAEQEQLWEEDDSLFAVADDVDAQHSNTLAITQQQSLPTQNQVNNFGKPPTTRTPQVFQNKQTHTAKPTVEGLSDIDHYIPWDTSSEWSDLENTKKKTIQPVNKKAKISIDFSDDDFDFAQIVEHEHNVSLASRLSAKSQSGNQHNKASTRTYPMAAQSATGCQETVHMTKTNQEPIATESRGACFVDTRQSVSVSVDKASLSPEHNPPSSQPSQELSPVFPAPSVAIVPPIPARTHSTSADVRPSFQSAVPFTYLAERERHTGQITYVKGYISTLLSSLDCNQGRMWTLKVKVNDGSATCEMFLSDKVLADLIGASARDAARLKSRDPEVMHLRNTVSMGLKKCQQTLVQMSSIFTVDWSQVDPVIIAWCQPTEEHKDVFQQ